MSDKPYKYEIALIADSLKEHWPKLRWVAGHLCSDGNSTPWQMTRGSELHGAIRLLPMFFLMRLRGEPVGAGACTLTEKAADDVIFKLERRDFESFDLECAFENVRKEINNLRRQEANYLSRHLNPRVRRKPGGRYHNLKFLCGGAVVDLGLKHERYNMPGVVGASFGRASEDQKLSLNGCAPFDYKHVWLCSSERVCRVFRLKDIDDLESKQAELSDDVFLKCDIGNDYDPEESRRIIESCFLEFALYGCEKEWKEKDLDNLRTIIVLGQGEKEHPELVSKLRDVTRCETDGRSLDAIGEKFKEYYLWTVEQPVPFGGRKSELERLDAWLNTPEGSQYYLLAGSGGQGKSALLVHWIDSLHRRKSDLMIAFYPVNVGFETNRHIQFLRWLAWKMSEFYGEEEGDESDRSIDKLRSRVSDYLKRDTDRPLLIVVDGLDEADGWSLGKNTLPPCLGKNIKLLVSTRPLPDQDPFITLERLGATKVRDDMILTLGGLDVPGTEEIIRGSQLSRIGETEINNIARIIHGVSNGSPFVTALYIGHLADKVKESSTLASELAGIEKRKPGLRGYFDMWWEHQEKLSGEKIYSNQMQSVLNVLSTAFAPMSFDELKELTRLEIDVNDEALRRIIKLLGRLVITDGFNHGYVLCHPELRHYFRNRMSKKTRSQWDARMVSKGRELVSDLNNESLLPRDASRYFVRYYSRHLLENNAATDDYLDLLKNGWLAACMLADDTLAGLISEVNGVWEHVKISDRAALAAGNERLPYLAAEVRCALIENLVASHKTAGFTRAMVDQLDKVEVLDKFIQTYGYNRTKDRVNVRALPSILAKLWSTDPARSKILLEQGINQINDWRDQFEKVKELVRLAVNLPDLTSRADLLQQAAQAADKMPHTPWKCLAFTCVALASPSDSARDRMLDSVVQLVTTLPNEEQQVAAACFVAGYISFSQNAPHAHKILEVVRNAHNFEQRQELENIINDQMLKINKGFKMEDDCRPDLRPPEASYAYAIDTIIQLAALLPSRDAIRAYLRMAIDIPLNRLVQDEDDFLIAIASVVLALRIAGFKAESEELMTRIPLSLTQSFPGAIRNVLGEPYRQKAWATLLTTKSIKDSTVPLRVSVLREIMTDLNDPQHQKAWQHLKSGDPHNNGLTLFMDLLAIFEKTHDNLGYLADVPPSARIILAIMESDIKLKIVITDLVDHALNTGIDNIMMNVRGALTDRKELCRCYTLITEEFIERGAHNLALKYARLIDDISIRNNTLCRLAGALLNANQFDLARRIVEREIQGPSHEKEAKILALCLAVPSAGIAEQLGCECGACLRDESDETLHTVLPSVTAAMQIMAIASQYEYITEMLKAYADCPERNILYEWIAQSSRLLMNLGGAPCVEAIIHSICDEMKLTSELYASSKSQI